ncbi:MAG TPA: DnaJ domain-containing protein [Ktedonobacteraceae bacterium]|jgi:hypothetical protein|nr:DnaJ domain-containing protein [Ktedonobacteraceae bacterium]
MAQMDTPDNYYATLGVPIDADFDTIKRAYRQLARRYHPDLAGPEGAGQMKRINRAYDVLRDPEKRLQYDTILGGTIDIRRGGIARPRPVQRRFDPNDDIEFAGLSVFSTKGPFHTAERIHAQFGIVSSLSYLQTEQGGCIAAGSLDGKGLIWYPERKETPVSFAADAALTVESLRELRFSEHGKLLVGWGRLGLHVWNTQDGALLWSHSLLSRAVSAYYSLDVVVKDEGAGEAWMALPLLREDPLAPRSLGVRGTDIVRHGLGDPPSMLSEPVVCAEDAVEKRRFWAIRLRTLSQDARTLLTLSCAHVPDEQDECVIIRRWNWQAKQKTRLRTKTQPQILVSLLAGHCEDCTPPYAITPDTGTIAFVYAGKHIRIQNTATGTYGELNSGTMGASSRLVISPGAQWIAVAREDSEVNEGVVDVWSVPHGEIVQRLYHPWQVSALHFTDSQLIVALTDGTIQIWRS